jgi:hypothetical protein
MLKGCPPGPSPASPSKLIAGNRSNGTHVYVPVGDQYGVNARGESAEKGYRRQRPNDRRMGIATDERCPPMMQTVFAGEGGYVSAHVGGKAGVARRDGASGRAGRQRRRAIVGLARLS